MCVCVCVSGKPAASGQHRVQRPRPEGAAAAWQGMNQITASIVSACCPPARPVCPPAAAQALAFTQSFSRESPSSQGSVCLGPDVKVVYFCPGLCEGGHPDECQQEEPAATPPLSGKRTHHPARTFHSVPNPQDHLCGPLLHLCVNRRVTASPAASRLSY